MRALLDTQALLYFSSNHDGLTEAAREFMISSENSLLLSAASIWEIVIKTQVGKLTLTVPIRDFIEFLSSELNLAELSIDKVHIYGTGRLPLHHRDPFDRLLIAQAIHERIPIVTGDKLIRQYDVEVVW